MQQRIAKVTLVSLVACVAIAAILAAAAYWRLSQGPVSLSFLRDNVRATISEGLGGVPVDVADVVIERNSSTGRTDVRIRDLRLYDNSGVLIAKAPRAAIEVKGQELLTGKIIPIGLRLIGPNIKVRRLISGEVRLGFGDAGQGLGTSGTEVTTKGDSLQSSGSNTSVHRMSLCWLIRQMVFRASSFQPWKSEINTTR